MANKMGFRNQRQLGKEKSSPQRMCLTQSGGPFVLLVDFGGVYNFPLVKVDFIRVKGVYILYTTGPFYGRPTYYNM